jgi:hypothetical protein
MTKPGTTKPGTTKPGTTEPGTKFINPGVEVLNKKNMGKIA